MTCVVEVNEHDEQIGIREKLRAHQLGLLHRAFSIFVFNNKGELLLQQRADEKYHCGGLWTNTCCSHPSPGEDTLVAAHRRLVEEMGFDCELDFITKFRYRAELENGLVENEIDHIFKGQFDGEIPYNSEEVKAVKYISWDALKADLKDKPQLYTPWLKLICENISTI